MLRLSLLGGFRVEWQGELLPESAWKRPQARTLLKLLAVEAGHRLHREQIIERLWPEHTPEEAAGRLRNLLYVVRRSLPGEAGELIEQRGEMVLLDPGRAWIDADAFEATARSALSNGSMEEMEAALGLYGGELLPEDRYAEWAEERRDELAALHRQLLLELARTSVHHGESDGAVNRLRELLSLDPAHEAAHRELMRLHAGSGNRREALRQYERCREILAEEVGVEPDPETEALRRQIEAGAVSSSLPVLPPAVIRPWRTPMIGRERALDLVLLPPIPQTGDRGAADSTEQVGVVLVRGEAGVGKTRLAAEAAREAGKRGCLVLWGSCAVQAACGPFVEALEQHVEGLGPAARGELARRHPELARILPSLDPEIAPPSMGGAGEELRLFAAVARLLGELAALRPVLLVLDDLQLGDQATLALLGYLARLPVTRRNWLILGTYRIEEAGTSSGLAAMLGELQRSVRCRQVDLLRLGRRECDRLVESVLEGDVEAEVREHIYQTSLGNPLFAVELLRTLQSFGELIQTEGGWQLAGSAEAAPSVRLPDRITDLIDARITALDEDTRRLLALAAVAGMSVPFEVLQHCARIMGQRTETTLDGLERAAEARVLEEGQDPALAYRFQHPLFREVVYSRLGAARRMHLHDVVARAIETVQPAEVETLAYHFDRSGNCEKRIEYLERAGDRARSMYANVAAESHYRTLLSLLAPGDSTIPRVQMKLGTVLSLTARHDETLDLLEAAAAQYEAAGEHAELGRVLAAIGQTHAARGTPEAAIVRLQEALSSLEGRVSPVTLAGIAAALANVFYACSRYPESLKAAERAETLSRPYMAETDAQRIHAQAEVRRAAALSVCGRSAEAAQVLLAALPEVEASGDLDALLRAVNNLGVGAQLAGNFETHQRYLAQALEIAERMGDPARVALLRASLGQAPLFTNDWKLPGSLALAEQGYRELKALGDSWYTAYAALYLGWILLWLGRWEKARPVLEESVRLGWNDRQVLVTVQLHLAELDLLEGRVEAARSRLEPLCAASEEEDDLDGTLACGSLARILCRLGERERALALASRAVRGASRMGPSLYLLETLVARGAVMVECGAWAGAEADATEALALARRMRYGAREATALLLLGWLEAARGNHRAADRLFAESRALIVRLGGEGAARGIDAVLLLINGS